ncbi:MarR family winged helix-turn-helix transcriptional regulator [Sulfurospirillum sp. 1612]|uniref:MarR family winged helix-turn-helix transcriptional regulator n=1 Tax=Sulfurospirillum sp. 1612 TaxID=3094835 RepID=UPI002F93232E
MKDLTKYISVSYRRTQMFYTEHLKETEISSGQFMYIVCICEHIGLTQDELSHRLIIDKSTVARVLSQLESSGFVTKKTNTHDRREFHLFPTEKALAIYPKIVQLKEEWHHKLVENLSDIERDILAKLLEKVMENAVNHCKG